MKPAGALSLAATVAAFSLAAGCAPPPKEIDYTDPDAGAHPEAPVLLSVTPEDGEEGVSVQPIFHLQFDRHIDAQTLNANRFRLNSGDWGRAMISVYDPTRKTVLAWPGWTLLPESTWILSLRPGIFGLNDAPVKLGVVATFRTGRASESEYRTPYQNRYYETDIAPIFGKHCTSCHGGAGRGIAGLELDTKANILETAVGVAATGRQEWKRIAPTRPGESYLLYKLTSDDFIAGRRMPRGMDSGAPPPPLSDEEKRALFDWIAVGAHFVDPPANED